MQLSLSEEVNKYLSKATLEWREINTERCLKWPQRESREVETKERHAVYLRTNWWSLKSVNRSTSSAYVTYWLGTCGKWAVSISKLERWLSSLIPRAGLLIAASVPPITPAGSQTVYWFIRNRVATLKLEDLDSSHNNNNKKDSQLRSTFGQQAVDS